jgi:hypothetical protein
LTPSRQGAVGIESIALSLRGRILVRAHRLQAKEKQMRKLIAGGLTAALSALMFAASALASSYHPKGEYAQFNECPIGPDGIDYRVQCMRASFKGVNEIHESLNKPIKRGTAESASLTWLSVLGNNCYVGSDPTPVKQKVLFETGLRGASAHARNSIGSTERSAERNAQPDQFFEAAQLNKSPQRGR